MILFLPVTHIQLNLLRQYIFDIYIGQLELVNMIFIYYGYYILLLIHLILYPMLSKMCHLKVTYIFLSDGVLCFRDAIKYKGLEKCLLSTRYEIHNILISTTDNVIST